MRSDQCLQTAEEKATSVKTSFSTATWLKARRVKSRVSPQSFNLPRILFPPAAWLPRTRTLGLDAFCLFAALSSARRLSLICGLSALPLGFFCLLPSAFLLSCFAALLSGDCRSCCRLPACYLLPCCMIFALRVESLRGVND
jgi:hypothetical protein